MCISSFIYARCNWLSGIFGRPQVSEKLLKSFQFLLLVTSAALLSSCNLFGDNCKEGEGDPFEQVRTYETISSINFSIPLTLNLIHNPDARNSTVSIVAQENTYNNIFTKVEDHQLTIEFTGCLEGHGEIIVYVESPDLREVIANSPSRILAENAIELDSFQLEVNQSSNVDLFFVGHHIQANLNGSGSVVLKGGTEYFNLDLNSNMQLNSYGLLADTSYIKTTSNKDIQVFAFNILEAEINGTGDVYYKEQPEAVSSGSGSGILIEDI